MLGAARSLAGSLLLQAGRRTGVLVVRLLPVSWRRQQRQPANRHHYQQLQHSLFINPHSISAPSRNCAAVGPIATIVVGVIVAGAILGFDLPRSRRCHRHSTGCGPASHHRHHHVTASPAFFSFASGR